VSVDLRVVDDPARAAAELLAAAAVPGAHVAVCGGNAVGAAFEAAARLRPDWGGVHLWFGDDRAVPPDDERSNYRLARETLLDALAAPPQVHRIRGEHGAKEAADLYDAEVEGVVLDLALNGIGPDGHTASLFPHAPTLDETQRRAVAAEAGFEPFVPRVTLTRPVFAQARLLLYLVVGEAKADAARRAFGGEPDPGTPASLVRGRTTVTLLDAEAASLL
jgi:6-phosphogluconolactonase